MVAYVVVAIVNTTAHVNEALRRQHSAGKPTVMAREASGNTGTGIAVRFCHMSQGQNSLKGHIGAVFIWDPN